MQEEMRRFEDAIKTDDSTLPPPPMFKVKKEGEKPTNTDNVPSSLIPPQISNAPNFGPNFGFQGPPNNGPMPMNNTRPNNFGPRPMFNIGPPPHFAMGPRPMGGPPMGGLPMGGPPRFGPPSGMPFIPIPQMDFSGLPEKKTVYSSAPVLKKQKLEETEKPEDTNNQVNIGPAKSSSISNDIPSKVKPKGTEVKPVETKQTVTKVPQYNRTVNRNQTNKKQKYIRTAAGQSWADPTLNEWDPNDYRIFCGDLGNEVTDDTLTRVFTKYPSFQKARVVRDKNTMKSRGYGFVSMRDPEDFIRAIREMQGKYVGNRPIKLKKSTWQDRNIKNVRKRNKEKKRLGYKV